MRRRNGRPDTPEERMADAIARGEMAPQAGGGNGIFNQPQVFPGENFGFNDITRAGTYLSDWYFNQMGDLYNRNMGLLDRTGELYNRGNDLYNRGNQLYDKGWGVFDRAGSLVDQGQNLFGRFDQLANDANISGLVKQVAGINSDVLGGRLPQAVDQIIEPYVNKGLSKINAGAATQFRQADDQLPRALAAVAKMEGMDARTREGAELQSNLYNTIAPQMLANAMAAGSPQQAANLLTAQGNVLGQTGNLLGQQAGILGQQGGILGQQGGILGQQGGIIGMEGNILGQQEGFYNRGAMTPWQIVRDIMQGYNARDFNEKALKQSKGK